MSLRSGLASQVIVGDESAWGVYTPPTRAIPHKGEGLAMDIDPLESEGIIAGQQIMRSSQWDQGDISVGGPLHFEFLDRSIGIMWKHSLGGVVTSSLGGGLYQHVMTAADLSGLGLSVQVGRPGTAAGVVDPYTYTGGKVATWECAGQVGGIVTCDFDLLNRHEIGYRQVVDGATNNGSAVVTSVTAVFSRDDVGKPISGTGIPANTTVLSWQSATQVTLSANATATAAGVTFTIGIALITPTYASGVGIGMRFIGSRATVAGGNLKIKGFKLKGDNGFEERRFSDGDGTVDEPIQGDLREITGEFSTEYFNRTEYNRFVRGQEMAVVLTLAKGSATARFDMNVRYDGKTPAVDGRGPVPQTIPWKCLGPTTDASAFQLTLVNTDSTP